LANAGGDSINSIKQGAEFGIVKGGQKFAGLLVFASDVNALGLQTAQGLTLTETWYWDMTDANRVWTKRWQAERGAAGKVPARGRSDALSEGGGGIEERRGWQSGSGPNEADAGGRSAVRQRHYPPGWTQNTSGLFARGEGASGFQASR